MKFWRKEAPPPAPAPWHAVGGSSEPRPALPADWYRDRLRSRPPPVWTGPTGRAESRVSLHVLLFLFTLISMMAAGAVQQGVNPFHSIAGLVHLVEGIPFAATLLAILTIHEFGHYFAARKWGVKASLPYFIPLPYISFLGTLGAVIRMHSPIPHKRALLDIGAAGPLAGFVVAVVACCIGLPQSEVLPDAAADSMVSNLDPFIEIGAPLLFQGLSNLLLPEVGAADAVLLSPIAFAGWVGLFITAFNLFPVGQLDGGHIVYALFGRGYHLIGRATFFILLGMGLYGIFSYVWELPPGWPGWLFLALLLTLFGRNHPPLYYPNIPLDRRRQRLGLLSLLVFAVCFTPVPFSN